MLIKPSACPAHITAQIAIVGAGPAGVSLALDLARCGVDVVLLSSGGLAENAELDQLSKPAALPAHHVDPTELKARRLGGLSWSWGGRCVPFDAIDFEQRHELDLPDWPIAREELMARAGDAATFLGVGAPDFDDPRSCMAVPATVERWCAQPQLLKPHLSALEAADGPRTYLDVTCIGAEISENGRVTSLRLRLPNGRTAVVTSETVVLAAGGLETARLLLWLFESNGRTAPRWTGRGYMGHLKGQLASVYFSNHPVSDWDYQDAGACFIRRRFALSDADLRANRLNNIAFHIDNPDLTDPQHGQGGLSAIALGLATPVIGKAMLSEPMRRYFLRNGMSPSTAARHARNVAARPISTARFLGRAVMGRLATPVRPGVLDGGVDGAFSLAFHAEQRPRFENGLRLAGDRDRYGLPRAEIRKSLQDSEVASVIDAHHLLAQRLQQAHIARVAVRVANKDLMQDIERQSGDGYHQIGLTRMGNSVADSVVDRNARVHGLKNLFVAGAATFPRSGQANPTFSIVCQALRLSDHLQNKATARRPIARFTI